MDKLYLGVDIGGTTTKLGAFTASGEKLAQWAVSTDVADGGTRILPNAAAEIRRYAGDISRVAGVGVGVPGPVRRGGMVSRCVNLGWERFNPAEELAALLDGQVPVRAGNDANLAALGEYWQGSGQGAGSLVLITLGTGVGGGVIIDGRVVHGAHGLGGEIGHTVISPSEPLRCNCGHHGCLDQMASATGIVRGAQRRLEHSGAPSSLRNLPRLTARAVLDAAKAGDALARQVADECLGCLGRSLSMVSYVLDPDLFILGGGVSQAGDYLLETVKRHYIADATLLEAKADIVLAALGSDAGIYGAAYLAMGAQGQAREAPGG